ncbi:hypothetical protein, partial [Endozoicomonas acroporae]|uniref:hypothetical protein n=1 Tax=Endozoicomonas acroporae TaxID=1701104 RepID=UPI003D7A3634
CFRNGWPNVSGISGRMLPEYPMASTNIWQQFKALITEGARVGKLGSLKGRKNSKNSGQVLILDAY